ncbi:hypothetical protein EV122DRAFT_192461, partial [Schizophyllum commune]
MVRAFIKHVLGVGSGRRGFYGPTSAYYGAVEQQGRLTLHLHTMLWIRGAPSPQTIRDKLLAGNTTFEAEMIRYLEEMQTGQFLTGDIEEVKARMPYRARNDDEDDIHRLYLVSEDPTQTLPTPPPDTCRCHTRTCDCEEKRKSWWSMFRDTVDNLILRVQIHRCIRKRSARVATYTENGKKDPLEGIKGCKGDDGVCDARFPRDYVSKSYVDRVTGAIHVVKKEVMMNCVTPVLTYLTRGNTDTTSLQSGTSMKAVVMYVSDYITKCSLKTYHIMSCIKSVFERHAPMFEGSEKDHASARRLMVQMVNALAPRMEIGSPMAASYLLGMPDHYKSHEFVVFWWKSYVNRVLDDWPEPTSERTFEERLILRSEQGQVIGTSVVDDYVHRPLRYENYSLYEWVQCAKKAKRTPNQLKEHLEKDDQDRTMFDEDAAHDGDDTNAGCVKEAIIEPQVLEDLDRIPRVTPLMDGEQESPIGINRRPPYESFLETHPQHKSHHVWCDPSKREYVVPNFVGGAIPRSDQGDREYYCATMLTLFAPWRRGRDLKSESSSWDTAFKNYNFNVRQRQLIENFNLRYECADARDDFHNELKKKKRAAAINLPIEEDADLEDDVVQSYGEDIDIDVPVDGETGPNWNRIYQTVEMARTYADVTGWTTRLARPSAGDIPSTTPVNKSRRGSEWADYIQKLKKSLFNGKFIRAPGISIVQAGIQQIRQGLHETGVVTLPATYFTSDAMDTTPDLQDLIRDIIQKFSLNENQQRAFSLIANHA